jgi:hypothetical protein
MSTPKLIRAIQHLSRHTSRMVQMLPKILVRWLLRNWLLIGRRTAAQAGFVLPTTILLLLVVTLTVGAIGYRTFTRSQQVIGERQQKVIYNAATPAIDRAKAKLEFLFDVDKGDKRGGGVPKDLQLMGMMLNDGRDLGGGYKVDPLAGQDPYTLPQETRIDINGDGRKDNAWWYNADLDGDGVTTGVNDGRVFYSMIFTAPGDPAVLRSADVNARATAKPFPLVRNAPLSNATQTSNACSTLQNAANPAARNLQLINGEGWFPDETNSTKLRKNFQVDAYVVPNNPNSTVATLEFQQDREASQGFKWAAWFRNDLEIFPGPPFNWNGAMHTEGNLVIGGNQFRSYMISSPFSCLYDEKGSEITATNVKEDVAKGIPKFQGQFITGTIRDNNYNGSVSVDIFNGASTPPQNQTMTAGNDSLNPPGGSGPAIFSLDPVKLQVEGVSAGRTIPDPAANRDGKWEKSTIAKRLVNAQEDSPYVDDTFRADNRWGPYPRWGRDYTPLAPNTFGRPITGSNAQELTGDDPPPGQPSSVGLDGYWERRARREGLRLIVGQRLELGDPAGWGGPNPNGEKTNVIEPREPLKPWDSCPGNSSSRCNEARQRRMLWDNLAAVQATAVYHLKSPGGLDFPAACIATTVHPGTPGTLDKSATFEDLAYKLPDDAFANGSRPEKYHTNARSLVISDFFRGRGTNGWEYQVPPVAEFSNRSSNLMTVLRNLAQFAGDPSGGAPSFPPVQERGVVHPHPPMAMWGDFSNLRQVIALMDSGTAYDALSPADKTTLHTAGCSIGMLAYNIDYLEKLNYDSIKTTKLAELSDTLKKLLNRNTSPASSFSAGFQAEFLGTTNKISSAGLKSVALGTSGSNDPEVFVRLMERWRDNPKTTQPEKDKLQEQIYLAQLIITKEQVARDRRIGFGIFEDGIYSKFPLGKCVNTNKKPVPTKPSEEPGWRDSVVGNPDNETDVANSPNPEAVLSVLCSARPRYPILYSLFPASDATLSSPSVLPPETLEIGYSSGFISHGDTAAPDSGSVRDIKDSNDLYIKRVNPRGILYRVVKPELVATVPLGFPVATIAPSPGYPVLGSSTTGALPVRAATVATGSTPNSNEEDRIKICTDKPCSIPANPSPNNRIAQTGTLLSVPFKDSALFNGREMMSVRALDLNLDLMRQSPTWGADFWLPKSGLIYAFREDAVSESHIVRPSSGGTWDLCKTDNALRTVAVCQMNTGNNSALTSTDPPLSDRNISPKPVDYYADPDRRPYGFRLRNGVSLQRANDNGRGMSFVTHNPAYVQGYFNLHRSPTSGSTDRSKGMEEFTELLDTTTFNNFYTRRDVNTSFSKKDEDQWRPTEVLADAVTPLSGSFCDGSIEDGIITAGLGSLASNRGKDRYGCANSNNLTSYLNQNRPSVAVPPTGAQALKRVAWMRSNIADSWYDVLPDYATAPNPAEGESPIVMFSGNPRKSDGDPYNLAYAPFNSGKPLIDADNAGVQMNMIMVSGLVPSRPNQSYGGLHNFPRFLENWGSDALYISGAFLQLNFSTYATAPFDQDLWEVSQTPDGTTNEVIPYYSPPNRRWGYDVGLQYAAPGPVAERFKFTEAIRSEFYTEPPADDPYIKRLELCATNKNC